MAAVQAEDDCASFIFVCDLNGHHQEWLGSMTTNRHRVVAFDFTTLSGCDHFVLGPTHVSGGTLYLLMTDVPDLVPVAVVALIGNSDHSSLSAVISMAQVVPNLCVSWKVFLSQRLGILRKSWRVFHDRLLIGRCFRGFVLQVLEYCSTEWCSAADTHLKLLSLQSLLPGF